MNLIKYAVLLGVVPYLNFVYWREYGGQVAYRERLDRCPSRPITSIDARMHRGAVHEGYEAENGPRAAKKPCRPLAPPAASSHASSHCTSPVISNQDYGKVSKVDSKLFGEYKGEHLIQLKSPALTTTVLDPHGQGGRGPPNPVKALQGVHAECRTIVNPLASAKKPCIAVVQADIPNAFNRLRIGLRDEKTGATVRHPWFNHTAAPQPTGFFGMGCVYEHVYRGCCYYCFLYSYIVFTPQAHGRQSGSRQPAREAGSAATEPGGVGEPRAGAAAGPRHREGNFTLADTAEQLHSNTVLFAGRGCAHRAATWSWWCSMTGRSTYS